MLMILKKTYEITVTIQEGSDEFWEAIANKSGCDEVVDEVKACLAEHGFIEPDCRVRLTKFDHMV